MAADPRWEELSQSSRAALRWGWAVAVLRGDLLVAVVAPGVTSFDLLTGILLAHARDSEPRQLFSHFRIPIGAVLAEAGNPDLDADALLAAWRDLPAGKPPLLSADAGNAVDHARTVLHDAGEAEPVPLRVLFGGLLETANPVSRAIRRQLTAAGVDADEVVGSYREYLRDTRSYADFLAERHPSALPPVELPPYHADEPMRRQWAGDGADPADLVGIGAEVDGFACLIASKALRPPLAIGLFGEWGSGKSFFLRSLQRRIDTLVSDPAAHGLPQAALPFYTSIVQIEFNAWAVRRGRSVGEPARPHLPQPCIRR
jgi:hypothetical protein